ncbi:TPA: glycosyltransferase [Serratia marcescens]|uniref:glycosyltransferase n=2 Tax=Serratia TaxID=613 RepID=UPI00077E0B4E|nr:glycosyltransferase [Serratia marcescens]EGT0501605.1 glycosyltransferase family 4 protein [Serratia marcescens]EHT9831766.1 glycosyltransferase [Serratia marcescens]EIU0973215.1 glycosyltransferase [Serratia marcescens]EMB7756306.1 glycosyltransferase [Serratia marcescens]MDP8748347.1 glycosyltransferase [Serratia marcescens]
MSKLDKFEKDKLQRVMNVFPVLDAGGTEDVILKSSEYLIKDKNIDVAMFADCSGGRREQDFIALGMKMYDNPKAKNKKSIIENITSFRNAIKDFNPDIVHTHALYSLGIVYLTKLIFRSKFKIVHTGHGGPKSNYDNISKHFTYMADSYITLSKESYEKISNEGIKGNVKLIYNGTNLPDISEVYHTSSALSEQKLILGFIGRLTRQKGLPTLIDALNIINQRGIDFEFHLIGDGEDRAALEESVAMYGLEEKIIFHGYSSTPWKLLSHIPIVVIPSLWEQGALVAIEAIIRNHTVISTNINGLNDVVTEQETGYLFERMDSEKLAEILEELSLGKRALINIDKEKRDKLLFPERTGIHIYNLYKSLLQ